LDTTYFAVRRQIAAMGCDVFEVGFFKPEAVGEPIMLPRTWDWETLLRSIPWMRHQNLNGRNVYVRPRGEHNLSLVDDLSAAAVAAMKREGFAPALVVRTSPANHQVWLKHPVTLDREVGTAVARALAERFGGDRGAADWRHFGRLAGFCNKKLKYADPATGLYPFVLLLEAEGGTYPEAERLLARVSAELKRKHEELNEARRRAAARSVNGGPSILKGIDAFRSDARYGGDGNRIDLAFAIYAFAHGAGITDVSAAIRSRDLSHKGNERRQNEYVERTIRKAQEAVERQVTGPGR
jgi:RepB DNA-primase from phage plasmid